MMSAVQVFFADKMVAVSHLIGSDQLPEPDQVSKLNFIVSYSISS